MKDKTPNSETPDFFKWFNESTVAIHGYSRTKWKRAFILLATFAATLAFFVWLSPVDPVYYHKYRLVLPEAWSYGLGLFIAGPIFCVISLTFCYYTRHQVTEGGFVDDVVDLVANMAWPFLCLIWGFAALVPWQTLYGVRLVGLVPHLIYGILFPFGLSVGAVVVLLAIVCFLAWVRDGVAYSGILVVIILSCWINGSIDNAESSIRESELGMKNMIMMRFRKYPWYFRSDNLPKDVDFQLDYSFINSFNHQLSNSSYNWRENALAVHLKFGDERSKSAFYRALFDEHGGVREIAIQGIRKTTYDAPKVIKALKDLAVDDSVNVRNEALCALAELTGDGAAEILQDAAMLPNQKLKYNESATNSLACDPLADHCPKEGPSILMKLAKNSKVPSQADAIYDLGRINYQPAVRSLRFIFREKGFSKRKVAAMEVLGQLQDKTIASELFAIAESSRTVEARNRQKAVVAIGQVGDHSHTQQLVTMLNANQQPIWMRISIVKALGHMQNPSSQKVLLQIAETGKTRGADSGSRDLQIEAIRSLQQFNNPRAIQPAIDLLARTSRRYGNYEFRQLIPKFGESAVPFLGTLILDGNEKTEARVAALEILEELPSQKTTAILIRCLDDQSTEIHDKAIEVMTTTESQSVKGSLAAFLEQYPTHTGALELMVKENAKDDFYRLALKALTDDKAMKRDFHRLAAHGERSLPVVLHIARSSRHRNQELGIRMLGRLGGEGAIELLVDHLLNKYSKHRQAAVDSLIEIGDEATDLIVNRLGEIEVDFRSNEQLNAVCDVLSQSKEYRQISKPLRQLGSPIASERVAAAKQLDADNFGYAQALVSEDPNPSVRQSFNLGS